MVKDINMKYDGVGIFMSNACILTYNVYIINHFNKGVLGILLCHKTIYRYNLLSWKQKKVIHILCIFTWKY